jgi:hypothetical protein
MLHMQHKLGRMLGVSKPLIIKGSTLRFMESLHESSIAPCGHEPPKGRRSRARVLDCGGKRSATPLFCRTLICLRASLVIRKRRRRPTAKRYVVTVVPFSALPAQSKTSRGGRRFMECALIIRRPLPPHPCPLPGGRGRVVVRVSAKLVRADGQESEYGSPSLRERAG